VSVSIASFLISPNTHSLFGLQRTRKVSKFSVACEKCKPARNSNYHHTRNRVAYRWCVVAALWQSCWQVLTENGGASVTGTVRQSIASRQLSNGASILPFFRPARPGAGLPRTRQSASGGEAPAPGAAALLCHRSKRASQHERLSSYLPRLGAVAWPAGKRMAAAVKVQAPPGDGGGIALPDLQNNTVQSHLDSACQGESRLAVCGSGRGLALAV
jgi:hypothetical protein